jgi:hypothetical protein
MKIEDIKIGREYWIMANDSPIRVKCVWSAKKECTKSQFKFDEKRYYYRYNHQVFPTKEALIEHLFPGFIEGIKGEFKHEAKILSYADVMADRSKAYKFLDIKSQQEDELTS